MQVFHSLMATRDARLAPLHIESLNRIDTDFDPRQNYWWSQKQRGKDRAVIEAWRMYWKHLNTATEEDMRKAWSEKSASLFFELLHSMSVAVGQSFTKSTLMENSYMPTGIANREAMVLDVIFGLANLVKGETALKMDVTSFPSSEEGTAKQIQLQDALLKSLAAGTLKVQIVQPVENKKRRP